MRNIFLPSNNPCLAALARGMSVSGESQVRHQPEDGLVLLELETHRGTVRHRGQGRHREVGVRVVAGPSLEVGVPHVAQHEVVAGLVAVPLQLNLEEGRDGTDL